MAYQFGKKTQAKRYYNFSFFAKTIVYMADTTETC